MSFVRILSLLGLFSDYFYLVLLVFSGPAVFFLVNRLQVSGFQFRLSLLSSLSLLLHDLFIFTFMFFIKVLKLEQARETF